MGSVAKEAFRNQSGVGRSSSWFSDRPVIRSNIAAGANSERVFIPLAGCNVLITMFLLALPIDLLRLLQEYLSIRDWRHFTACCMHWRELRRNTLTLALNKHHSKRYYESPEFRAQVYQCVHSVSNQLHIMLPYSNVVDVSVLGQVHTLNLSGCCGITGVSALSNVHTLNLSWCRGITDVSALSNVHTLDLSWCRGVKDVSALGNVHTLYLSWCRGITDVSALGNVHTLDLSCCSGITDVSALGHVHTLYLSGCRGITDVSALGHVHTLYLSHCNGITDVSALGNVHTLYLSYCRGITDVSALGVKRLIR